MQLSAVNIDDLNDAVAQGIFNNPNNLQSTVILEQKTIHSQRKWEKIVDKFFKHYSQLPYQKIKGHELKIRRIVRC